MNKKSKTGNEVIPEFTGCVTPPAVGAVGDCRGSVHIQSIPQYISSVSPNGL